MAVLGDVTQSMSDACGKASEAEEALLTAHDLVEQARSLLELALEGSAVRERGTILARLTEVVERTEELRNMIAEGIDGARSLLMALQGDSPPNGSAAPRAATTGQLSNTAAPPNQPTPPPPEWVEELRRALPPPVGSGKGQKTHGRWLAPDGTVHQIISGNGPEADAAAEYLNALPLPRPGLPIATSHAETKLAAPMTIYAPGGYRNTISGGQEPPWQR